MIDKKNIQVNGKNFIISKFPAVAGREIVACYPLSGLPKVGDYKLNESIMLKLMSYVAVITQSGQELQLTTPQLIDNHAGDWETLAKLELAMMEYNVSFFQNGRISSFFDDFVQKLPAWISKILTGLSAQSLPTEKQP